MAGSDRQRLGADHRQRRHALHQRIDGEHHDAGPLQRTTREGKPRQRRHPLGGDRDVRRNAVVRLAIPAGKVEDLDIGLGEGEAFREGFRARLVPRDEGERGGAVLAVAR